MRPRKKITITFGIIFLLLFNNLLKAQSVDEFTGDFGYGLPIISVPSPDGPGTGISAGYGAGIGVQQSSSEIGLGWGLNMGGAVSRNVSGIPDDWKGIVTANSEEKEFLSHSGCIYINQGGQLDFYKTDYKISKLINSDTAKFYFPDYDSYYVSGPNLSGSLSPHLFDFASIKEGDEEDYYNYVELHEDSGFARKMQFVFTGDYADTLISRHYPTSPISGSTTLRLPTHSITDGEFPNGSTVPFVGKGDEGFNRTHNRLVSSRYVEYFTNQQINDDAVPGVFIDYKTSSSRTSADFDMTGIGAYRITDENGFVYHYSQPIYINYEIHYNYPLNNDYSVQTYTYTTVYTNTTIALGDTIVKDNNYDDLVIEHRRSKRYAYQWLLCAITGPDYSDANSNGIADEGDKGYWIAYDYQLWTDNFSRRTPKYGLNYSFNATEDDANSNEGIDAAGKISGKYGTASIFNQELYYLNKIKTASHTSLLVYDLRKDDASDVRLSAVTSYTTTGPGVLTPQLKLNKVILLRNEEFAGLTAVTSNTITTTDGWNLNNTEASQGKIYNETWYTANKTAIDAASLRTVEFTQDYSLARKYYNNINTKVAGINHLSSPATVHSAVYNESGKYEDSGKLTLTAITSYEEKHKRMQPEVNFDYNKTVANDNPDYNPQATDYWGFYKSDISSAGYSSYTTSTSATYTDAWSMRKITLPEGGSIDIDYESDQYENVLKEEGGFKGATRTYSIKTIADVENYFGDKWDFTMEDNVSDFTGLLDNPPTGTTRHAFIPTGCALTNERRFMNSGTTFTVSATHDEITMYEFWYSGDGLSTGNFNVGNEPEFAWNVYAHCGNEPSDVKYTGNGYFMFELPAGTPVYGGGIRVKKLTFNNGVKDSYKQEYVYSGGVTPTEPDRFDNLKKWKDTDGDLIYTKLRGYDYNKHKMGPGVGYTQTTIKNTGQLTTSNGAVTTTFFTSDEDIDNYKGRVQKRYPDSHQVTGCCTEDTHIDTSYIIEVMDKFSSQWGKVREVQTTDVNNNIITLTRNEYSNLTQGTITENFHFIYEEDENLQVGAPAPCGSYTERKNAICILRNIPLILSKQTSYSMDLEASTEYLRFDEVLGTATMIRSTEPNKGITVSYSTPAFRIPEYATMGPLAEDSLNNKNVLSPVTSGKVVKDSTITSSSDFLTYGVQTFTDDHTLRKYEASVGTYTTVANNNQYWRPLNSYTWAGNSNSLDDYGLYKSTDFTAYTYSTTAQDSKWRFNSENTLIDERGHVLESKGFNDRFSASKYAHNNQLAIAQAGNCNYSSFTHTSFEDKTDVDPGAGTVYYFGGEVSLGTGNDAVASGTVTAHTGSYYLSVPYTSTVYPTFKAIYNTTTAPTDTLMRGRTYRAAVWTHTSTPSDASLVMELNGTVTTGTTSVTQWVTKGAAGNVQAGEWILMTVDLDIPDDYVSIGTANNDFRVYLKPGASGYALFDDFRVHPVESGIAANVYDPKTARVLATLDNNNFSTVYKYDEAGRILEVWKELENVGLKKVKKYQYTYYREWVE